MKLNKATQYGMLLALYLTRAGRSNLDHIAEGLNLSKSFLQQVARKMRISGIIRSVRGPSGGYELVKSPMVKDIFLSLSPVKLLSSKEKDIYKTGAQEQRALYMFSSDILNALYPTLNKNIKDLVPELMAVEAATFDRISADSSIN